MLNLLDYRLMHPNFRTHYTLRPILILILLVVAGYSTVHTPSLVQAQGSDADWLLSQINALRQSNGIPALVVNAQLAAAATVHSTYLSTHAWTSAHVEDNGSTPSSRAWAAGYPGKLVGENVVGGLTADVQWAFNWWLNSPVHFQNMLGSWQEIGIGVVKGETGQWYTLVFGSQAAGVVGPSADQPSAPPTSIPADKTDNTSANAPATKVAAAPPTRRPTRAPTVTPTITTTPTITFTPRATFTATFTLTPPPPTSTAIELEVSPQPTTNGVAVAMVVTPGSSVTNLQQSPSTPPATSSNSDSVRRLLPWLFLIQGIVVIGFIGKALFRRISR